MHANQPAANASPAALWVSLAHQVSCTVSGLMVPVSGTLIRLSEQGAWVRAEIELEVGRQMRVDWRPRVDRQLQLSGQIVGVKPQPESLVRDYGVRFVNVARADNEFLVREILDIDRRSKAHPERESSVSKQVAAQLRTKRAAYRVGVAFDVHYAQTGHARHIGKASNVSTGGLGFLTIETLPLGTTLEFWLDLPTAVLKAADRPFEKLHVKGRVVKAVRPDKKRPWEYGIAFFDEDPLAVAELRRYVHLSQVNALSKGIRAQ
jgi:hypothetical protein